MKQLFVEFTGTLMLTFVAVATGNYLAIGATLALAVLLSTGRCKQAFNPAVAVALTAAGDLSPALTVPYIIAEVAGALVGGQLAKMLHGQR